MDLNNPNYESGSSQNNQNYRSSNSPNFQINFPFDLNNLTNPNAQRMLFYNMPNQPMHLNQQFVQQFPNQFSNPNFPQQFPNQFPNQNFPQIPQNYPSGYMFPMSQQYGVNQIIQNSPTTSGGERSSNLTPPEDPRGSQQAGDDVDGANDDVDDDVVETPYESNTIVSREKWDAKEDDALISAWIECAVEDPKTTTDQSLAIMWRNIMALYDQAREDNPSTMRPRSLRSMKSRWGIINRDVSTWVGCYAEAIKRYKSGTNTHDEMTEAHEIYRGTCNGSRFGLIGCWEILRDLDKWRPLDLEVPSSGGGSSKR